LNDFGLYRPGSKIVIPLFKPNTHLTSACWRDFSKAVRENDGWDVKRIAVSEKKEYKQQSRNGAVYFVNAKYTVKAAPSDEYKPNLKATHALCAVIDSATRSKTGQANQELIVAFCLILHSLALSKRNTTASRALLPMHNFSPPSIRRRIHS
jgi:hypothetical protein